MSLGKFNANEQRKEIRVGNFTQIQCRSPKRNKTRHYARKLALPVNDVSFFYYFPVNKPTKKKNHRFHTNNFVFFSFPASIKVKCNKSRKAKLSP